MRYLKKFENFNNDDYTDVNNDDFSKINHDRFDHSRLTDCEFCGGDGCDNCSCSNCNGEGCEDCSHDRKLGFSDENEIGEDPRVFGGYDPERMIEKKKLPDGLRNYLDKKSKGKKPTKKSKEEVDEEEVDDKKKSVKGLTAKQKKLPLALQKSILARQNKK